MFPRCFRGEGAAVGSWSSHRQSDAGKDHVPPASVVSVAGSPRISQASNVEPMGSARVANDTSVGDVSERPVKGMTEELRQQRDENTSQSQFRG